MKRRLTIGALLALALLALCLAAAPAFAAYPNTLPPGVAAVHPWFGAEPVIWEETDADGNWYVWSAAEPAYDWAAYKAIPASYDVWFVGWLFDTPRGQMVRQIGNSRIDGKLYDSGGDLIWSIKPKAARKHWNPIEFGWEQQLINKTVGKVWVAGWTCNIGKLPAGTYSGTGTWTNTRPAISFLWDPEDPQRTPTHFQLGVWDCSYAFTVKSD